MVEMQEPQRRCCEFRLVCPHVKPCQSLLDFDRRQLSLYHKSLPFHLHLCRARLSAMGKKSSKEVMQEETPVIEATEAKQSKKKSKPTKPEDIQQADADGTKPAGVSAKELKKKLRESRTIRPAVPELPIPEEIKKSKKRKHRSENAEEKPVAPVEEEEPPKKKRKNRTEFADPRVDASLNSQARKGAL